MPHKVIINHGSRSPTLSRRVFDKLQRPFDLFSLLQGQFDRHDPDIIRAVEELGSLANGKGSRLEVVPLRGNVYRILAHVPLWISDGGYHLGDFNEEVLEPTGTKDDEEHVWITIKD